MILYSNWMLSTVSEGGHGGFGKELRELYPNNLPDPNYPPQCGQGEVVALLSIFIEYYVLPMCSHLNHCTPA